MTSYNLVAICDDVRSTVVQYHQIRLVVVCKHIRALIVTLVEYANMTTLSDHAWRCAISRWHVKRQRQTSRMDSFPPTAEVGRLPASANKESRALPARTYGLSQSCLASKEGALRPDLEHSKCFMRQCGTAANVPAFAKKNHHKLGESAALSPWRLVEQGHLRGGRLANAGQPGASGLHDVARWACNGSCYCTKRLDSQKVRCSEVGERMQPLRAP